MILIVVVWERYLAALNCEKKYAFVSGNMVVIVCSRRVYLGRWTLIFSRYYQQLDRIGVYSSMQKKVRPILDRDAEEL